MADRRTLVTELVTGLGMTDTPSLEEGLQVEPSAMVSVAPETWQLLRMLHRGGTMRPEFEAAWSNGRAFLHAAEGLRGRAPRTIEWKGSVRAPGDEVVPADLRVDHVYFVSCKYLSKIVLNASPQGLFERLLAGGHGQRGSDWFAAVAPDELAALYGTAIRLLEDAYPDRHAELTPEERKRLAGALKGRWPPEARDDAQRLATAVATRSAEIWSSAMSTPRERERLLWRLLRIGSAPYFVLGSDGERMLRLRIQTPWDWRQQYRLVSLRAEPLDGLQPMVRWHATVEERFTGRDRAVEGHVEVRWSHGKFCGAPEAKVYLDTPHHLVPGYVALA